MALRGAAIAGLLGVTASATAAEPSIAPAVPVLNWQPCTDPGQQGFDCATAQVPLNYDDPQGATVNIGLIRHPATDKANRIGAIFYNQGGPGATSTVLPGSISVFPPALRERFDIISWDPRGAGANDVECFAAAEDQDKFFAEFPVSEAEQRAWIRGYVRYGRLCAERNGGLLAYVSTVDTVNDLDSNLQPFG